MPVYTAKNSTVNWRRLSDAADDLNETLLNPPTYPYEGAQVYNWTLSWGYESPRYYWAAPVSNLPYSQAGVMAGQLQFSFQGCYAGDTLLICSTGERDFELPFLKFRLYYDNDDFWFAYAKPVSFTMHWKYHQGVPTSMWTDAVFDLVLYEPTLHTPTVNDVAIVRDLVCEETTCYVDILSDGNAVDNVKEAVLTLTYGVYDVYHAYNPLNKTVVGKQPNKGNIDATLAITYNDVTDITETRLKANYEIGLETTLAGAKWTIKWMFLDSIQGLVADVRTGALIEATELYKFDHNQSALAKIQTPSGAFV